MMSYNTSPKSVVEEINNLHRNQEQINDSIKDD